MFNMMQQQDTTLLKIDKTLKISILLLFIVLLILMRSYKLDSCDLCEFEAKSQKASQPEFMSYYFDECLERYKIDVTSIVLNFSLAND